MNRHILLAAFAALSLTACNITNYDAVKPTASKQDIAEARNKLSGIEGMKVTDEGYITYFEMVPHGYMWDTQSIKQASYEGACENLYDFLEMGFVVKIGFKGEGGREEHFDKARCDAEETN
ncbi:conserved hypothetical protein [Vibrio nigripulchritudo SFn27]|uniref:Lipoprotein n=1 Tax=Vibrio nigripulchritudo TaxID=28173 RepID=U4K110_9VIBR|nr:hypothetical protein [Vibrio nigripulchritudo]CCN85389.1 conserved hypothetical protein [Vibrio nigripulchritudo BLFn1]CCN89097.1 conserved hypothetical protein [Vibrio nigripulchritudo SFn27]CCN95118.1 conserved hypothetical protein [Vibrio nigripulchritudo ENn2]CCO41780.1 conserved hypothetical protein [Vibrio nigripulchritudo SFn135]CCO50902.1 conserved hypothetical protein [Vibrio nigripulchritudo Wn13]